MSRRLRCDEEGALGIDEACVHVVNEGSKDAKLYIVPWDAYINLVTIIFYILKLINLAHSLKWHWNLQCEGDSWGNVSASSDAYLRVSTKFSQHFYYKDDHEWCQWVIDFYDQNTIQGKVVKKTEINFLTARPITLWNMEFINGTFQTLILANGQQYLRNPTVLISVRIFINYSHMTYKSDMT